MSGKPVLQLHIFQSCKLRKQSHLLRQIGNVATSHVTPLLHGQLVDRATVKQERAFIVLAVAVEICAQRRLSATAFRRNQIFFSALKPERLQPHFRLDARLSGKHPRQSVDKFYCIHLYRIIFIVSKVAQTIGIRKPPSAFPHSSPCSMRVAMRSIIASVSSVAGCQSAFRLTLKSRPNA